MRASGCSAGGAVGTMPRGRVALFGLFIVLGIPVFAQDDAPEPVPEPVDDFRQTTIPETIASRFVCYQSGVEILSVERIAGFAPARVQGVMTFSLHTHDDETHLVYLDATTACRLVVTDR